MRRKIGLQGSNGKWVQVEGGGGSWVYSRADALGGWETFEVIDLGGSSVVLKCQSGQFLCAEEGGGGSVTATRWSADIWETFQVLDQGNNQIALRTYKGNYLSVVGDGVSATATSITAAAKFTVSNQVAQYVALRAVGNASQPVQAQNGGGGALVTTTNPIRQYETFGLVNYGGGVISLKAWNGQFVCADQGGGGDVSAIRSVSDRWEKFTVVAQNDGAIALKTYNGHYLCAGSGTGSALSARSSSVGDAEKFQLVEEQLLCAHRGRKGPTENYNPNDDRSIWFTASSTGQGGWFTDTKNNHGNQSHAGPALVVLHGTTYLVHGGGGDDQLWWSKWDSVQGCFTEDRQFENDNRSNDTPGVAVHNGVLYCAHRGMSGDHRLWWCQFNRGTEKWTEDQLIPGQYSPCGVSLASYKGKLWAAWRGDGDRNEHIYYATFDAKTQTWSDSAKFESNNYCRYAPTLLVAGGKLYCVHGSGAPDWSWSDSPSIGDLSYDMWWTTFDDASGKWLEDQKLGTGAHCSCSPGLAYWKGKIHCAHRGGSDQDLWWSTFDPATGQWATDVRFGVPDAFLTSDTPALVVAPL